MPRYHKLGKTPHKRHTTFKKADGGYHYEELFGTIGFDGMSSLLYHIHRPTQVKEIRGSYSVEPEMAVEKNMKAYLLDAFNLCKKNNVLFIADEVQTGIARTGKMICCDHHGFKPDILILGKALSGGVFPVSAVLSSNEIMLTIKPGEHGSTYGGNPLGCKVAIAALKVVKDEKLCQNSLEMGNYFRKKLNEYISHSNAVKLVRGKGLLNAIVIDDHEESDTAWNICLKLRDNGLLAKPTHGNIIRFAPPLTINKTEIDSAVDIIVKSLKEFETSE